MSAIQSIELVRGDEALKAKTGFTEGNEGMTKEGTVGGNAMGVTKESFTGESRGSRDGTGGGNVGGTAIGIREGNLTGGNEGRARRGTVGGTPTGAGETPALPGTENSGVPRGLSGQASSIHKSQTEILGRRRRVSTIEEMHRTAGATALPILGNEAEALDEAGWALIAPFGEHPKSRLVKKNGRVVEEKFIQVLDNESADRLLSRENSLFRRIRRAMVGIPVYKGHPDLKDYAPETAGVSVKKEIIGTIDRLRKTGRGIEAHFVLTPAGADAVEREGCKFPSALWFAQPFGRRGEAILARPFKLLSAGLTAHPNICGVESLANAAGGELGIRNEELGRGESGRSKGEMANVGSIGTSQFFAGTSEGDHGLHGAHGSDRKGDETQIISTASVCEKSGASSPLQSEQIRVAPFSVLSPPLRGGEGDEGSAGTSERRTDNLPAGQSSLRDLKGSRPKPGSELPGYSRSVPSGLPMEHESVEEGGGNLAAVIVDKAQADGLGGQGGQNGPHGMRGWDENKGDEMMVAIGEASETRADAEERQKSWQEGILRRDAGGGGRDDRATQERISEQNKGDEMKMIVGWLVAQGAALANSESPTESQVLGALQKLHIDRAGEVLSLGNEKSTLAGENEQLKSEISRLSSTSAALENERADWNAQLAILKTGRATAVVDLAIARGKLNVAERAGKIEALGNAADFEKESSALLASATRYRTASSTESGKVLSNQGTETDARTEYCASVERHMKESGETDPIKAHHAVMQGNPGLAEALKARSQE